MNPNKTAAGAIGGPAARRLRRSAAFTLIEVMVAIAVVATALVALLGLHHQSLLNVIKGQDLAQAGLLAQARMSAAELERFPPLGATSGDFASLYPGQYPHFRWERTVESSAMFPDVRKVRIRIIYGAGFHRSFELVEFLHGLDGQSR